MAVGLNSLFKEDDANLNRAITWKSHGIKFGRHCLKLLEYAST